MLKRYYSIEEAAEFLTSVHGQNVTRMDVLTLARHGDIRLCTWFDGSLELFRVIGDPDWPSADLVDTSPFKGYIQISKDAITPNGGEITFSPVDSIEVITYTGHPIAEVKFPYEFELITSNCGDAVIPAQDIVGISSKKVNSDKPLTPKERDSLLTIIGIMAKDGYGNDLSKPFSLANEIQKAAELQGIKISVQNIAEKLIAAKIILDEKS